MITFWHVWFISNFYHFSIYLCLFRHAKISILNCSVKIFGLFLIPLGQNLSNDAHIWYTFEKNCAFGWQKMFSCHRDICWYWTEVTIPCYPSHIAIWQVCHYICYLITIKFDRHLGNFHDINTWKFVHWLLSIDCAVKSRWACFEFNHLYFTLVLMESKLYFISIP